MKKLLLLAIAFLAFTGFTNNNVKELDFDSTSLVMSPQSLLLPPSIKDAEPSNREVIVKEGTTASFSIAYESAESADVEITRQGSSLGENCT